MFGGLTKTSSRIALAAALGMTFWGYAMSTPAKAADLGGDCCADLEERVAELEATTVRKGNKKVSLTISGWVTKSANWWWDGEESNMYVGDKGTTLSSHFQLSGSATIAPGWSGGYTMSIEAPGVSYGFLANQINDDTEGGVIATVTGNANLNTLLSYMWVKSDKYGTLNWGLLSQATDNVALLPDLSGTIIESNAVMFEGGAFGLRAKGNNGNAKNILPAVWSTFLFCNTSGLGIGADCNGVPYNAIRYDSPTFGGFSMSTSYGEDDIFDIAIKYAADFNSFKVSAAAGWTHTTDERYIFGGGGLAGFGYDTDLFQVGASALHVPSGLFIYGLYQNEDASFSPAALGNGLAGAGDDTDVWYLKGGIKRTWNPLGATVLFAEYGQYHDQFGGIAGSDVCAAGGAFNGGGKFVPGTFVGQAPVCFNGAGVLRSVSVTGSEVERFGLGAVQEIDSAAMHLYARWQHLELDVDLINNGNGNRVGQSFEDYDLFQVGGVIFF
ncbi:MAG: porin [Hyphomicrobiales bacterium]